MVNSNASDLFICEHIKIIESAANLGNKFLPILNLQAYQGDESVKSELLRLEVSGDLSLAVQVSPTMFYVFGPETANHPAGYCHVKVQEDSFSCCSKDCKTTVAKGKQLKARIYAFTCIIILISLGVIHSDKIVIRSSPASTSLSGAKLIGTNVVGFPGSEIPSSTKAGSMAPTMPNNTASDEPVDTASLTSTVQLNMKRSLPLQTGTAVIQRAYFMDIKGWPPSLAPSCVTCGLHSGPLSGKTSPRRKKRVPGSN